MSLAYVEKQCECGKYFTVHPQGTRAFRCPECQDEANRERTRLRVYKRRQRENCHLLRSMLIVEHDPLSFDEGGFKKGATILPIEWKCMKELRVIGDGFRVKYPDGKSETYQRNTFVGGLVKG